MQFEQQTPPRSYIKHRPLAYLARLRLAIIRWTSQYLDHRRVRPHHPPPILRLRRDRVQQFRLVIVANPVPQCSPIFVVGLTWQALENDGLQSRRETLQACSMRRMQDIDLAILENCPHRPGKRKVFWSLPYQSNFTPDLFS